MTLEKKWEIKKVHIVVLMALVFAGCLVVLSFINYSNGDDAFFLEYCGSMGFGEYLKWRYETWTGRMASEAIMHIFFNIDIWFWRIVNAGMLAVLPLVLVALKNKIFAGNGQAAGIKPAGEMLLNTIMALFFYLLLDIKTFGYSCIWITGSMNYLWPVVCGMIALYAVAMCVNGREGMISGEPKTAALVFVLSVPCAVIAALSSEQMGAVILAFEVICLGWDLWQKKPLHKGLVIQTGFTVAAFAISGLAPGNELRVADSIAYYMPQFETMELGERIFISVQWLISSFANENAALLMSIWIVGIFCILCREKDVVEEKNEQRKKKCTAVAAGVFTVVAFAGKMGVSVLCDFGINLAEMTGTIEQVPVASDMSIVQWIMLGWWGMALVFTFFFLWEVTRANPVVLLTYLGAIASEAVLIFSPTMYSSGERVFFLTGVMLIFLVMALYELLPKDKIRKICVAVLVGLGILNFLLQAKELLAMLAG